MCLAAFKKNSHFCSWYWALPSTTLKLGVAEGNLVVSICGCLWMAVGSLKNPVGSVCGDPIRKGRPICGPRWFFEPFLDVSKAETSHCGWRSVSLNPSYFDVRRIPWVFIHLFFWGGYPIIIPIMWNLQYVPCYLPNYPVSYFLLYPLVFLT